MDWNTLEDHNAKHAVWTFKQKATENTVRILRNRSWLRQEYDAHTAGCMIMLETEKRLPLNDLFGRPSLQYVRGLV